MPTLTHPEPHTLTIPSDLFVIVALIAGEPVKAEQTERGKRTATHG